MKDGPVNIAVPLTPALSPSPIGSGQADGEREKAAAAGGLCWGVCMDRRDARQERPPLPPPLLPGGGGGSAAPAEVMGDNAFPADHPKKPGTAGVFTRTAQ